VEQLPLAVRLRDTARLESFMPGRNREALESIGTGSRATPKVLWLWGRPGTGKTHLLQGACAAVAERGGSASYLDLAAAEPGGRLYVSSSMPPAALEFQLPDLRSRLLAASVHQLQDLDEAEQAEALRLRASRRGLELGSEGALYLVHRLPRDMHSLCAVLDRLDEASLAAQRRLTVPFLRAALEAQGLGAA